MGFPLRLLAYVADLIVLNRVEFPIGEEVALQIYNAGTPSPHGVEGKTVLDPSYRSAHELKVRRSPESASMAECSRSQSNLPSI